MSVGNSRLWPTTTCHRGRSGPLKLVHMAPGAPLRLVVGHPEPMCRAGFQGPFGDGRLPAWAAECRRGWPGSALVGPGRLPVGTIRSAMRPSGITANLSAPDIAEARDFYVDYLGLSVEAMNLGWVARFQTPDGRAAVQLVTRDATSPHDSVISVHVGDQVEAAYEDAKQRGYEIVHPLTTEPWGVRRFLVRAPDGNVVNIVSHWDD